MKLHAIILLTITPFYLCQNITNLFEKINKQVLLFNERGAELSWESSVNPGSQQITDKFMLYHNEVIVWEKRVCEKLIKMHNDHLLNSSQATQTYLMCRGPKYNLHQQRLRNHLYNELLNIYTRVQLCFPTPKDIQLDNFQMAENVMLKYLTRDENVKDEDDVDSKVADDFVSVDYNIAFEDTTVCIKGDRHFQTIMELSKNETVLRWIWQMWRKLVGPPMKEPYRLLIAVENVGARNSGNGNLGESWRQDLEIPHLRQLCRQLYNDIRPLYTVLHGVVRFYLRRFYGEVVPERGPIPAHLLGNLWSQNWEPLIDLISPKTIDLNQSIKKLNWTVLDLARKAEDFYQSFGLPAMTKTFWQKSEFAPSENDTRCHGTAADMFKRGDFRIAYCSGTRIEDLYVFIHEMGHIHYFMAYENQPALFRSAHEALHESIGDAVMYGVMTPQHLHRLGLINDSLLYIYDQDFKPTTGFDDNDHTNANSDVTNAEDNHDKIGEKKRDELTKEFFIGYYVNNHKNENTYKRESGRGFDRGGDENEIKGLTRKLLDYPNVETDNLNNFEKEKGDLIDTFNELFKTDDILMLKLALSKLPQIPFSLLIDEYRWKYFEGGMSMGEQNKEFWTMVTELQGIAPPFDRGEEYFDIGAYYNIPNNTPQIRYFLSSFLQHQLFETLCKAAVYGRRTNKSLPDSITLNRCDIYGSKTAGKILKDLMSRGNSQHWKVILKQVTGDSDISAVSLVRYYRPLYEKLLELVRRFDIPIGWKKVNEDGWYFA